MNRLTILFYSLACCALIPHQASAAVTVFDSFSEGSLAPSSITPAAPLELGRRLTNRSGIPNFLNVPTFIADGVLTYSISLRDAPFPSDWFELAYNRSNVGGSFNLLAKNRLG